MQGQITYRDISDTDLEIQNVWMKSERIVHRGKVKMFYSEFQGRLDTIAAELSKIAHQYCVIENGFVKIEDGRPVLLEGKSREEYDTKVNAFLDRTCPLI